MRFVGADLIAAHGAFRLFVRAGEKDRIGMAFRFIADEGVEQGAGGDQHFGLQGDEVVEFRRIVRGDGGDDGGDAPGFEHVPGVVEAADPAHERGAPLVVRRQEQMDEGHGGTRFGRRRKGRQQAGEQDRQHGEAPRSGERRFPHVRSS